MSMSKNGQHYRSTSYDSACYKTHISFKESHHKRQDRNGVMFLPRQQNDDNITLVETETEKNEDDDKYFNSSFLLYLDDIYSKYSPAVVLENKGNTARDHLANERTYLAWFRTSLSLITLGIGIIQVYHVSTAHHKRIGRALGLIFVFSSILFLYFGNVRYFHAQWALQHGMFTVMLLETGIGIIIDLEGL
ncbi:hypothetical protein MFLAVUS_001184 [Mucor flavus]|uniref:DUF202 domain-containing protein n=1 Tax=Mucor flavus TaxID=439312 RepID=A0ABP9YLS8_9FUNG